MWHEDQPMHPRCWVAWYLLANQNSGTSMTVGSRSFVCCVLVEHIDLDYPGVCYLLHLMWLSPKVLHLQAYCPHVALELKCWCSQLLPLVHPSHPALCWSWWEVNSSYTGPAAPFPIPGVYHINWYMGIGPLFHYIFPIFPSVLYLLTALEGSYTD